MVAQPFEVNVPQKTLDDLQERLARTRWTDEVEGAGWDYGTNLDYLRELVNYWQNGFDWREQEAKLNRFSHFRAEIDGFGLHFIHEIGKGPDPMPLVLTHGWPDSFYRFHKVIPMLTDPESYGGDPDDSFDVIVPSLPGYGFSEVPRERAMTTSRIAGLFARLMTGELGYQQFVAHGGDWGSSITEQLALDHDASLVGIHLTEIPYTHLFSVFSEDLSEAEKRYLEEGRGWQMEEGGYAMIQATKPQTLAYGLNDSPVGLAAWIVEKFRSWSDCGGDIERRFSKDEFAHQHHAVLGDGDDRRLHAPVLRSAAQPAGRSLRPRADGRVYLPEGSRPGAEGVRGALLRRSALDRDAARRSFCGDGGARTARRGHQGVLPSIPPINSRAARRYDRTVIEARRALPTGALRSIVRNREKAGSPTSSLYRTRVWALASTGRAVVDKLGGPGPVEHRRNPQNRRAYELTLTDAGHETLSEAKSIVEGVEETVLVPLNEEERRRLHELLLSLLPGPGSRG